MKIAELPALDRAKPLDVGDYDEIDGMFAEEEQIEAAKESQQVPALRAELAALKGEGVEKETK